MFLSSPLANPVDLVRGPRANNRCNTLQPFHRRPPLGFFLLCFLSPRPLPGGAVKYFLAPLVCPSAPNSFHSPFQMMESSSAANLHPPPAGGTFKALLLPSPFLSVTLVLQSPHHESPSQAEEDRAIFAATVPTALRSFSVHLGTQLSTLLQPQRLISQREDRTTADDDSGHGGANGGSTAANNTLGFPSRNAIRAASMHVHLLAVHGAGDDASSDIASNHRFRQIAESLELDFLAAVGPIVPRSAASSASGGGASASAGTSRLPLLVAAAAGDHTTITYQRFHSLATEENGTPPLLERIECTLSFPLPIAAAPGTRTLTPGGGADSQGVRAVAPDSLPCAAASAPFCGDVAAVTSTEQQLIVWDLCLTYAIDTQSRGSVVEAARRWTTDTKQEERRTPSSSSLTHQPEWLAVTYRPNPSDASWTERQGWTRSRDDHTVNQLVALQQQQNISSKSATTSEGVAPSPCRRFDLIIAVRKLPPSVPSSTTSAPPAPSLIHKSLQPSVADTEMSSVAPRVAIGESPHSALLEQLTMTTRWYVPANLRAANVVSDVAASATFVSFNMARPACTTAHSSSLHSTGNATLASSSLQDVAVVTGTLVAPSMAEATQYSPEAWHDRIRTESHTSLLILEDVASDIVAQMRARGKAVVPFLRTPATLPSEWHHQHTLAHHHHVTDKEVRPAVSTAQPPDGAVQATVLHAPLPDLLGKLSDGSWHQRRNVVVMPPLHAMTNRSGGGGSGVPLWSSIEWLISYLNDTVAWNPLECVLHMAPHAADLVVVPS